MSPTPILDLEQEPPEQQQAKRWVGFAIFLALSVAVGALIDPVARVLVSSAVQIPALNGLLFLPALYVAILIHELGHLAVGKLVGMETGGLCVGGLVLAQSGQRWILRFDRRFLFGGLAISLPPRRDLQRSRFAWMVAGGPVASLLLTGLCALGIVKIGGGNGNWIGTLFWSALITVASSVLPYSVRGMMSDGARLWQLLTNPERTRWYMNLRFLLAEEMKGVRPRDWDPSVVKQVLETGDSEAQYASVQLLAFYRSRDRRDDQNSLQHVENALSALANSRDKNIRRSCFLVAAGASANEKRNPAQARIWLDRAARVKTGRKLEGTEGIQAWIAMAEGRYSDAIRHWEGFRDYLNRKRLDSGTARLAKERLAEGERDCRTALGNSAAGQLSVSSFDIPPATERQPGR